MISIEQSKSVMYAPGSDSGSPIAPASSPGSNTCRSKDEPQYSVRQEGKMFCSATVQLALLRMLLDVIVNCYCKTSRTPHRKSFSCACHGLMIMMMMADVEGRGSHSLRMPGTEVPNQSRNDRRNALALTLCDWNSGRLRRMSNLIGLPTSTQNRRKYGQM